MLCPAEAQQQKSLYSLHSAESGSRLQTELLKPNARELFNKVVWITHTLMPCYYFTLAWDTLSFSYSSHRAHISAISLLRLQTAPDPHLLDVTVVCAVHTQRTDLWRPDHNNTINHSEPELITHWVTRKRFSMEKTAQAVEHQSLDKSIRSTQIKSFQQMDL